METSSQFHPTYRYPAIGIRYLDRVKETTKTRKDLRKELKMLAAFFLSVKVVNKWLNQDHSLKMVPKVTWNLFHLVICPAIRQIQMAVEWTIWLQLILSIKWETLGPLTTTLRSWILIHQQSNLHTVTHLLDKVFRSSRVQVKMERGRKNLNKTIPDKKEILKKKMMRFSGEKHSLELNIREFWTRDRRRKGDKRKQKNKQKF